MTSGFVEYLQSRKTDLTSSSGYRRLFVELLVLKSVSQLDATLRVMAKQTATGLITFKARLG